MFTDHFGYVHDICSGREFTLEIKHQLVMSSVGATSRTKMAMNRGYLNRDPIIGRAPEAFMEKIGSVYSSLQEGDWVKGKPMPE